MQSEAEHAHRFDSPLSPLNSTLDVGSEEAVVMSMPVASGPARLPFFRRQGIRGHIHAVGRLGEPCAISLVGACEEDGE